MIIYSIVITALMASVLVAFGYERISRVRQYEELQETRQDLEAALGREKDLQIVIANMDGVSAGRSSDMIYRKTLEQFDRGGQITVMFQPEKQHYYADR